MIKFPITLTLLLTIIFFQEPSLAQQKNHNKDCGFCQQGVHSNTPPYTLSLKTEKPFIIASTILLATSFIIQATNNQKTLTLNEINSLNKNDLWTIDRSAVTNNSRKASRFSDYIRTSITFLPIYFLANHHTKDDIGPLAVMSLEVLATTYGLTNIAKNIARRPRPFAYNPDVSISKKMEKNTRRSFFSGHTSHTAAFTFFIAKVVTDYHPNAKKGFLAVIWSGAALIPATTGYLRIKAGKHFPTDVIAGYITGAFVGYIIPKLHSKRPTNISFAPILSEQGSGLSLSIPIGSGFHKAKKYTLPNNRQGVF